MTVSFASNVVTISGSTEGSPDTLAGIVAAVGNTALCRMDDGRNFWIGGTITKIDVQGWLLIDNGQSFQCGGSVRLQRTTSGAGITFKPRSRWVVTGTTRGADQGENSFGTNFNVVCERDSITGDVPLWFSDVGTTSRDDSFSALYVDSSTVKTPKYRIQGLHMYFRSPSSIKIYPQSDSDEIKYLTITKDDAVSGVFEFQTIPSSTADTVFSDATIKGFTAFATVFGFSGRKIMFDRLRINSASAYTIEYVHWYGNATNGLWEFRDLQDIGAGSWNGQIKRTTSGGADNTGDEVRVTYTDQKQFLAGATPVQNVNCRWVSSDATNAPAQTDASDSSGNTVKKTLLKARAPNTLGGGSSVTPTPVTWSLYARKYGSDTQPEWALYESQNFTAPRNSAVQITATNGIIDSQATADAYTGIALTDHGASPASWNGKSWRYTITGDLSVNGALTAANIWHFFESSLSKQAAIGGTPGLELHDMVRRITASSFETAARSGRGVRIVDQSGNPFPGIDHMTANDGTTYTPPVSVTLAISAQVSLVGAEIHIYDLDNSPAGSLGSELSGIETSTGSTFSYTGSAGNLLWIQIMLSGYEEFGQSVTMPSSSSGFVATLQPEENT